LTFLPSSYFGLYRDFVNDCRNNALPDYAFIEPPYVDQDDGTLAADHHPDSFVLAGDRFIRNVYEAIRSCDEVWRSTLFLIVLGTSTAGSSTTCRRRRCRTATASCASRWRDRIPCFNSACEDGGRH